MMSSCIMSIAFPESSEPLAELPQALVPEVSDSNSPPMAPDVLDKSKNSGPSANPEIESANKTDVSSDNCSNLYLGKLVSDTDDDDENYDVITGEVNEDAMKAATDSNDNAMNDVVDDMKPLSGSGSENYTIMRQDPLTKEKFVPIDEEGDPDSPKLEERGQTVFVPLSNHPSSSVTTPKPAARTHHHTKTLGSNKAPKCVSSDQCITCNPQITAKMGDDKWSPKKVERSLKTFTERSTDLECWLKSIENTVIEVSSLLNSEILKKEKIHELFSDLLRKDIVMKSMNRMGREVSQEVLKIDRKSTDDVIQTVMRTLNQRWQTVVNLVHSMESNLSPRSTEVIIASEVTPGLTTASITPNMTPISTSAKTDSVEAKPAKEHKDFLKGRLSALATSNQESVHDWYHLRSDLSFELKKLANFKMLYHYPPISKPIPVQYCNKHWHEYLSGTRPISVASNPDTRNYSTKSLPNHGSRLSPQSPVPTRSLSVASRPYTPKLIPYMPSRKSRSMTRSHSRSHRSLSPTSSYGDLEHSRDSEVDDLIKQANDLYVPPPPPPPININPDQFIAYKMPCMFRCQYCGQTQPVFLPENGIPIITSPDRQNLPTSTDPNTKLIPNPLTNGVSQTPKPDISGLNLSLSTNGVSQFPKPDPSISNLLKLTKMDPKSGKPKDPKTTNSLQPYLSTSNPSGNPSNSDNSSVPIAYFAPSCSNSHPIPVSNSFPGLKMPQGSVPPGSQILIIPPGGTLGSNNPVTSGSLYPISKYSSNLPPDLQKIMEKYCPTGEDEEKPSRDQLVADALSRFEEKKKKKEKEDYLNSLKDKRNHKKNDEDKKEKSLRFPIDSDDEIIADPNKQKQLHSSNPFGFDDFGPNAPNSKNLRELELAATAAAKWWEKTKKRLDEEKSGKGRAKSKSPERWQSENGPLSKINGTRLPVRKTPGSSGSFKLKPKTEPAPDLKGKSMIPGSDDECIAEFPNREKLESALDDLDYLDDKLVENNIQSNKKPSDFKNNNNNKNNNIHNNINKIFPAKPAKSTLKTPRIEVPGDSSVESTPRPGARRKSDQTDQPGSSLSPKRKIAPTTPRDFKSRVDKIDKDSDVESRSGFTPRQKPVTGKPKNLDLKSIERAADAGAKWFDNVNNQPKPNRVSRGYPKSPGEQKGQPKINMPDDDDEDEILAAVPSKSLFSAPPPLITKNSASTTSLLSDPESLDAPPSARNERFNHALTSRGSQIGPFSPSNMPVSQYSGTPSAFGPGNPGTPGRSGNAPGAGGGGLVNFGNVNMYIMQSDPSLNKQALEQADKVPAVGGGGAIGGTGGFQSPQNALPAIKNVSSPDGKYEGNLNAYRQRTPRSNTSTPSQEKSHNPARPFQAFAGNQFQENFERTSPYPY